MSVPISSTDLNPEWFTRVLEKDFEPNSFKVEENVQDGVGFSSTISRVALETVGEEGRNGDTYSLIVKMSLEPNPVMNQAKIADRFDITEIFTYNQLLPDLVRVSPNLDKYFCRLLYSEIQKNDDEKGIPYGSVMILEDMEAKGYETIRFADDLRRSNFDQGLQFLAEFHTASRILENTKNSTVLNLYPWFPQWHLPNPDESITSVMHARFCSGFEDVLDLLRSNSGNAGGKNAVVIEAFQRLSPHADQIFKFVLNSGEKCLIHGDLWPCNLLVHSVPKMSIKVLDFQMLGYADPTYDLAPFILASLSLKDLKSENVIEYARSYHKLYISLNQNRNEIQKDKDFLEFFKTYGLSYGLI